MKRRIVWGIWVIIAVGFVAAVGFLVSVKPIDEVSGKPVLGATVFPIADIAENIGGGHFDIVLIVPPGASPHTFEPRPENIVELSRASEILSIGHGSDDWVAVISDTLDIPFTPLDNGIDLICDDADEHGDEHGDGCDPHYWLDVSNAEKMATQIRDIMIKEDPDNALVYNDNARDYISQLEKLDNEIKEEVSEGPQNLIGFHDSWRYFARRYELNIVGSFQASPGREPSVSDIKKLSDLVAEYGVKKVFKDPQLSESAVKQFTSDLDLEIGILDPLGGIDGRDSYIQLMKFNADSISQK